VPPSSATAAAAVNAQHYQHHRQLKQRHVWAKRWRELLRATLALLVVAALAGLFICPLWVQALWIVPATPQGVVVQGSRLVPHSALMAALQPLVGQPLWGINPQQVEANLLKAFPLISFATVRRQMAPQAWPHMARVVVYVKEQEPWALLYPLDAAPTLAPALTPKPALPTPEEAPRLPAKLPQPYAYVLANGRTLRWQQPTPATGSPFIETHWLAKHPRLFLISPSWYRGLPAAQRQQLLGQMDQLAAGLNDLPTVALLWLECWPGGLMKARLRYQGLPLHLNLGRMEPDLFVRALRLRPLLPLLAQNLAQPTAKARWFDAVDLRWHRHVYLHQSPVPAAYQQAKAQQAALPPADAPPLPPLPPKAVPLPTAPPPQAPASLSRTWFQLPTPQTAQASNASNATALRLPTSPTPAKATKAANAKALGE
jgi:hypothetical protein